MSWEGIRDERLMSKDGLLYEQDCHGRMGAMKGVFDHIDGLHDLCRYIRDLASHAYTHEMFVSDNGWSTMVAIYALLEENLGDTFDSSVEATDTTVSGYTLRWQGPGYGVAPDDYGYHACPCCNGNPCECHLPEPDPHYEDYLAAWDAALDAGELDDAADAAVERDELVEAGLLGYSVDLGYVGYEALLNG